MAKFCGKCGSALNDTAAFCVDCGSPVPSGSPAPSFTPVAAYVPGPAVPPAKGSNTLLKVIIAVVVLLFAGAALAAAGLWYVAQKIRDKAVAAEAQSPALASVMSAAGGLAKSVATGSDDSPTEFKGDPCRFLSTQEVSQAVGVPIIRAEGGENGGCSYIARGDPADMTAKHMTAMAADLGGHLDAKSKKTVESLMGGLFSQQEAGDKNLAAEAAKGEVPVLGVMLTVGNAEAQMQMNRVGFQHIAGGSAATNGNGDLDGIGDEAYLAGDSMLMVRKGDTIAQFLYTACPCNTANIKPLAKLAAGRL